MVVAVEVFHQLHLTVDRKPVGMYVERTHEDGDHQSFVVKILMFLDILYHHDFTVGRCYYHMLGIAIKIADRTTVEVKH